MEVKKIMAAEVPISILLGKLQKLKDEKSRLIFPGLRNRVVTAVDELEKILRVIQVEEPSHENTSSSPREDPLLHTLDSLEYCTEYFLLMTAQRPLVFPSWRQLQFYFEMKKLVESVRDVSIEFGISTQPHSHYSEGQHRRRLYNLVGIAEELVARLINDNEGSLYVISLVIGEETLGKETLAEIKNVYKRQDIQKHFKLQAWLHVREDVEYKDLLRTILKQLSRCISNIGLEVMSEEELSYELVKFLMKGRFLIVLEYDVQTVDVWLKLVRQFQDNVNGSRVIFTTRKLNVALNADLWSSPLVLIRPLIEQQPDVLVEREDDAKKLVALLIKDDEKNLQVISVVGEEALGKSHLARNVYNRLVIRQHFPLRAWLHVSGDLRDKDAYKDILVIVLKQLPKCVLKNLELMSETQLSDMLFQILMKHRYLIVLDNVQTAEVWLKLVRPFADANGSRVILITRYLDVAKEAAPWSSTLLKLSPLTEKESWSLFLKKVGRQENNTYLDDLREQILRICHGLPLAIVLLGGVLSTIEFTKWSKVVNDLTLALQCEGESPLSKMVAFSYHQLPSVLKPCFLYLALFPKAYEIPIRRLLHLWLAEGFVQLLPDVKVPEDVAKIYLEELVFRNMIEIGRWKSDGSPKTCRMPTFLYDNFFPKAKDMGFLHVRNFKSDCSSADTSSFNIRRLADQFGIESTSESHIQHLYSYFSFDPRKRHKSNKEIGNFLNTIINGSGFVPLKVLNLEGIYRPLLPEKLGELRNLQYIGLRWTGLDSCPASIGDLPCLETLDLKYTDIITLPSSIWKPSLRHLYMNEVSIINGPSKPSSTNLQTLTGLVIGAQDPDTYGLKLCTNLRKLGLTCNSKFAEETAKCIKALTNLRTLKLRSREPTVRGVRPPLGKLKLEPMKELKSLTNLYLFGEIRDGIGNLPRNLRTLTLSMSKIVNDPMPVLGELRQLSILRLFAHSYAGSTMTCRSGDFTNLHVLKLWMLENLEHWTVEKGAMPKLAELEIRACEKMISSDVLETLTATMILTALKELILTNMPQDFVADVRSRLSRDILLTNNWESTALQE